MVSKPLVISILIVSLSLGMTKIFVPEVSATDSYYSQVADILILAYKWVGIGYHIICTRGYPLPAKN